MLNTISEFWHSFSHYHHHIYVLLSILQVCFLSWFINFILNKFVDNFTAIYCKYAKYCIHQEEPPILLQALIKTSRKPLAVLIWIFCILAIFDIINNNSPSFNTAAKVLVCILIGTWLLIRVLQQIEEYLINFVYKGEHKQLRKHKTTIIAIWRLLKTLVFLFSGLMIMQALHVDITGLVAIGSASTLVLGLAAKELLANFFGGIMIFTDEQFMVGDSIKAPSQNIEGIVEYIGWRLTRIKTADKSVLYVPNSIFLTIGVENSSRRYNYQIKETLRLQYHDVQKINIVIEELLTMIRNHPGIDTTQITFVGINKFNVMTADCLLWCFTKATDVENYLKTQHDVLYKTDQIISQHGLAIGVHPSTAAAIEN